MRDQRGHAVAVEATIIVPALVLFVALVVFLARDALTQQAVGASASQAARAASLERSVGSAKAAAMSTATGALTDAGITCRTQDITVDASALNAAPGQPASLVVTVTCLVEHDLTLPGFPPVRRVSEVRSSPVDTYRSR